MILLVLILLFVPSVQLEDLDPVKLLKKDIESLNCLFFRRNCTNHLADLSSANRLFWKVSLPKFRKVINPKSDKDIFLNLSSSGMHQLDHVLFSSAARTFKNSLLLSMTTKYFLLARER